MSVYATVEDFEAYMGPGWTTEDAIALEGVIIKAERDVDEYIGLAITETGFIYDPTTLDVLLSNALRDATCAQTEYRMAMGEPFFSGVVFGQEGPDITPKKTPPRISPYTKNVLVKAGLVKLTGRFT